MWVCSLALPDPLRTGAYRLEIISAALQRVWNHSQAKTEQGSTSFVGR